MQIVLLTPYPETRDKFSFGVDPVKLLRTAYGGFNGVDIIFLM